MPQDFHGGRDAGAAFRLRPLETARRPPALRAAAHRLSRCGPFPLFRSGCPAVHRSAGSFGGGHRRKTSTPNRREKLRVYRIPHTLVKPGRNLIATAMPIVCAWIDSVPHPPTSLRRQPVPVNLPENRANALQIPETHFILFFSYHE